MHGPLLLHVLLCPGTPDCRANHAAGSQRMAAQIEAWLLQQQADIQIQLQHLAVFFGPDTEEVHRHWLRFVQKVWPTLASQ